MCSVCVVSTWSSPEPAPPLSLLLGPAVLAALLFGVLLILENSGTRFRGCDHKLGALEDAGPVEQA